jgi:hypothetical protein
MCNQPGLTPFFLFLSWLAGPQLAGEELRYIIVDEIDRQISPLPKHAPVNARISRA